MDYEKNCWSCKRLDSSGRCLILKDEDGRPAKVGALRIKDCPAYKGLELAFDVDMLDPDEIVKIRDVGGKFKTFDYKADYEDYQRKIFESMTKPMPAPGMMSKEKREKYEKMKRMSKKVKFT